MYCNVENIGEGAENLESVLNKFWSAENKEAKDNCVIHDFEKYIFHNRQRYVTKSPFRPGHEFLPDNFSVCEQRLEKLKNRLTSENLVEKYDEIFKEYEQNNIIEMVPFDEVPKKPGQVYCFSYRPVLKEDKETTKIRAVFDESCASDGPSLNDCLYSGPNLLSKIFDILLRFRFNFTAILADIKKANVEISKEHGDFLRFLLYENVNSENDAKLIAYRFLRVVFGVTTSPFLLNGTNRHYLSRYLSCDQ